MCNGPVVGQGNTLACNPFEICYIVILMVFPSFEGRELTVTSGLAVIGVLQPDAHKSIKCFPLNNGAVPRSQSLGQGIGCADEGSGHGSNRRQMHIGQEEYRVNTSTWL